MEDGKVYETKGANVAKRGKLNVVTNAGKLHFVLNAGKLQMALNNRQVLSCPKLLFSSEAKCKANKLKCSFIFMQIKLMFTRKILH